MARPLKRVSRRKRRPTDFLSRRYEAPSLLLVLAERGHGVDPAGAPGGPCGLKHNLAASKA